MASVKAQEYVPVCTWHLEDMIHVFAIICIPQGIHLLSEHDTIWKGGKKVYMPVNMIGIEGV